VYQINYGGIILITRLFRLVYGLIRPAAPSNDSNTPMFKSDVAISRSNAVRSRGSNASRVDGREKSTRAPPEPWGQDHSSALLTILLLCTFTDPPDIPVSFCKSLRVSLLVC